MDDVILARALHVLAIVHWIGGVAMVTTVILPSVARLAEPERRLPPFEAVEGRFGAQARYSVTIAGITGFWMTYRLEAWHRFAAPGYWWMHAMVVLWAVFTLILFVAEPWFLRAWFRRRAARDPQGTLALVQKVHRILLTAAVITILGAVLGAHGVLW